MIPLLAVLFKGIPIIFAYILGAPPAIITAIAALWSLRFRRPEIYILTAVVSGALSSTVWPPLLTRGALLSLSPLLLLAAIGALTGAACGLLTLRLGGFDLEMLQARLELYRPDALSRFRAGDVLLMVMGVLSLWLVATLLVPALAQRWR